MDVKETSNNLLGGEFVKTAKDRSSLGKDDFMKLMLTQLQHQDPMAPQDANAQIAQMAQLSSLEQLQNLNASIQTMAVVEAAGTNSQTVSYIGKIVEVAGNTVSVDASGNPTAEMHYTLPENSESVDITITDENGKTVRTIKASSNSAGKHKVEWDGKDDNGNPVPEGKYSFDVAAVNKDGGKVEASTSVKGKVTGITYESGYPELIVGGEKAVLGTVIAVDGEEPEPEAESVQPMQLSRIDLGEKILTKKARINNIYNIGR